ncbi:retrovirus-related pol polyprotein from transposon TNT 1-94 [Tanacetum coccineum]
MHEKTMTPSSCLRWKPMGKIFNSVGLRWVPTGKIFASSTTKVDSKPTNGSNEDITNQYECEQTLDVSEGTLNLSAGTSFNPKKEGLRAMTSDHNSSKLGIHDHNNEPSSSKLVLKVVPPADKTATSRQELRHLILAESDSLPHAHAQTTKTYYKHQDSSIKKAQVLKTKTSANSDIKDNSLETKLQGRLLESFQDDANSESQESLRFEEDCWPQDNESNMKAWNLSETKLRGRIKAFSCNALADLGASINLMPYSLYAKLSLETLKPTKMSVRLADRSFQHTIGIAENMLVEVGKFTFHVDFVILEMEEDSKVPLILERPFLYTADAVIRVK